MVNRDKELLDAGWERRSITENKRIDELIELYESLDYEVHLEPLTKELIFAIGEECKSCFEMDWDNYKMIYTRKK